MPKKKIDNQLVTVDSTKTEAEKDPDTNAEIKISDLLDKMKAEGKSYIRIQKLF
jgi:uncharacterized protein (DUF4415 family)